MLAKLNVMTIPTEQPRRARPLRTFLTFAVPAVVAAALTFGGIAIYNSVNTHPADEHPHVGNGNGGDAQGNSKPKNSQHGNGTHGNNQSEHNGEVGPAPAREARPTNQD